MSKQRKINHRRIRPLAQEIPFFSKAIKMIQEKEWEIARRLIAYESQALEQGSDLWNEKNSDAKPVPNQYEIRMLEIKRQILKE